MIIHAGVESTYIRNGRIIIKKVIVSNTVINAVTNTLQPTGVSKPFFRTLEGSITVIECLDTLSTSFLSEFSFSCRYEELDQQITEL